MIDEFLDLYQKLVEKYRLSPHLSPPEALSAKATNMQNMLDSEVIGSTILRTSFEEDIKFLNEIGDMIERIGLCGPLKKKNQ